MLFLISGLFAGLHAACYGAYKDSPYERFKVIRFFREMLLATTIAIIFSALISFNQVPKTIFFLITLAWSRIITEAYKLFIRTESQKNYLIPSQIHFFRKIVQKRMARFLFGFFIACIFAGLLLISFTITKYISFQWLKGMLVGLIAGLGTASGGGYKDGFFEGFYIRKFFRSPIIGALSGLILVFFTNSPYLLFFSSIGLERMVVECYKGFFKPKYFPGKFNYKTAPYPEYFQKRKIILIPYLGTWVFFIYLFINEVF